MSRILSEEKGHFAVSFFVDNFFETRKLLDQGAMSSAADDRAQDHQLIAVLQDDIPFG